MSAITDALIVAQAKATQVVSYVKANWVQLASSAVVSFVIGHIL